MKIPNPPTERQARVMWLALTGLSIAVIVGLVVALIWAAGRILSVLSPVLWPLAVAMVLTYLLDPVVGYFERHGLSRMRAIFLVFAIVLLVLGGVLASVLPSIVDQTRQLITRMPEITQTVETKLGDWVHNPPPLIQRFLYEKKAGSETPQPDAGTNASESASQTNAPAAPAPNTPEKRAALNKETLQSATGWVADILPKAGRWVFGQVVDWIGIVIGLVLVPIYTFYLLLEKRRIRSNWPAYLPMVDSRFKDETVFVLRSINNYLIAFFRGQVLVAVCDGILYGVGFFAIGLPYAAVLGLVAIVLTMIPFIGAVTVCVTGLILALAQYGDWLHPVLVLAVVGIVQALEALVISPKIMGGRIGLHPLAIIISVMAGTTLLGGLLGGILAIPFTATLRVLLARYIWKDNADR